MTLLEMPTARVKFTYLWSPSFYYRTYIYDQPENDPMAHQLNTLYVYTFCTGTPYSRPYSYFTGVLMILNISYTEIPSVYLKQSYYLVYCMTYYFQLTLKYLLALGLLVNVAQPTAQDILAISDLDIKCLTNNGNTC